MCEIGQIDVWIKRFKGRRLMVILSACVVLLLMSGMAGVEAQQSTPPHYELVVNYDLSDIEWNPDGTLLAISGGDSVTIYDINLQELATLQGHLGAVFSVSWSPDGNFIASTGQDGTIRIWQTADGAGSFSLLTTLGGTMEEQIGLVWSPDGKKLATMGVNVVPEAVIGVVTVWNTDNWQEFVTFPSQFFYDTFFPEEHVLAWSPNSTSLAVVGTEYDAASYTLLGSAREFGIYDPSTGSKLRTATLLSEFEVATRERIQKAIWNTNDVIAITTSYHLFLYDYNSETLLTRLNMKYPHSLSWSPNETFLATLNNGVVEIVATETGTALRTFQSARGTYFLDWNPTQPILASATLFGTIQLWDTSQLPDVSSITILTPLPTLTPTLTPT